MDDPGSLDLPERRLFRVVLARFAGGEGAAIKHGLLTTGALGTHRRETRLVRRLDPEGINEPVAEIVGQVEPVREALGAIGFVSLALPSA